jgi:hypothetical protein
MTTAPVLVPGTAADGARRFAEVFATAPTARGRHGYIPL